MPPNFGLPFIDAGIADTVRAAKLRDRRASLVLQTADNLYVGEASCALSLILSMGQSLLQNGLFQWGKVIANLFARCSRVRRGRL